MKEKKGGIRGRKTFVLSIKTKQQPYSKIHIHADGVVVVLRTLQRKMLISSLLAQSQAG